MNWRILNIDWPAVQRGQDKLQVGTSAIGACTTNGLRSGALREAAKVFKTDVLGVGPWCVEFPDGEIVTTRSESRANAIAALSLSSPIEPPPERGLRVPTAGGTCTHCGAAIYANSGHYCKGPVTQASSEIREAANFEKTAAMLDKMARSTTILAMELAYKCLQSFTIQSTHPDAARVRDICYTLLGTKHHQAEPDETGEWLAPSRQGAGGK